MAGTHEKIETSFFPLENWYENMEINGLVSNHKKVEISSWSNEKWIRTRDFENKLNSLSEDDFHRNKIFI